MAGAVSFCRRAAAGCSLHWIRAEGQGQGQAKAVRLSELLASDLQQRDDRVLLLGRVGSDAPEMRFVRRIGEAQGWWNYTHGGLAFRAPHTDEWEVVHLLNTCDELSGVFRETLEEFFLDNPWEYRAIVAAPTMQEALMEIVANYDRSFAFYDHSIYSSISYPRSLERQNSTEYVLDVLVAGLAHVSVVQGGVSDRLAAKEFFLSSSVAQFQPEAVRVGGVERVGIRLGFGLSNATLADHPSESKRSGEYEFVSVGSLIQFLDTVGMLEWVAQYALPDVGRASDTVELEP